MSVRLTNPQLEQLRLLWEAGNSDAFHHAPEGAGPASAMRALERKGLAEWSAWLEDDRKPADCFGHHPETLNAYVLTTEGQALALETFGAKATP